MLPNTGTFLGKISEVKKLQWYNQDGIHVNTYERFSLKKWKKRMQYQISPDKCRLGHHKLVKHVFPWYSYTVARLMTRVELAYF